ncbi:MAG: ATP synthase F1 subunit epsilon [Paludibacteraceae bacterium]|jgi:F-type H+-transporting ATPase subunit epsilon|nr:ATP synthase F1 subunit epsilon [Candidatus Riflebacteria bacterium]MBR6043767.1 ATP synthase F1 subunit epsilon [Paludibacteraceae bacterium]MCR5567972.1 ATP synthase F1 subunit epsilon [Paludibacteraceae bacterium]
MELEIISPERIVYTGEVNSVTLPGMLGQFTILPKHAALISSLKEGEIIYIDADGENRIRIDSGFAEVRDNKISVCIEKILEA